MELIINTTNYFRKLRKVKMKHQVIHQKQQNPQRMMSIKSSSHFQKVPRRLFDSQILNDYKTLERDIINDTQK